jgi:hypothetical protein
VVAGQVVLGEEVDLEGSLGHPGQPRLVRGPGFGVEVAAQPPGDVLMWQPLFGHGQVPVQQLRGDRLQFSEQAMVGMAIGHRQSSSGACRKGRQRRAAVTHEPLSATRESAPLSTIGQACASGDEAAVGCRAGPAGPVAIEVPFGAERDHRCAAGQTTPDSTLDDRPLFLESAVQAAGRAGGELAAEPQHPELTIGARSLLDDLLAAARLPPAVATWALQRRGRRPGRHAPPWAARVPWWCPGPSAAPSRCSARPRPAPQRPTGTARTSR